MLTSYSFRTALFVGLATALSGCGQNQPENQTAAETGTTLRLIGEWVHGNYNNVAQATADAEADLAPELMHRPMHQIFARIDAPQLEGYILYQQSSLDGSENPAMIFRHGLMQYLEDPATGTVRQRELYFKDAEQAEKFKNAHRNPDVLRDLTLAELTWDEGCDFYLSTNEDQTMVSGPLREGQCVLFNQGLQKDMYADDLVEITATEYRFRGRYVDEDGNTLWGTESPELNTMVRQE